MNIVHVGSFCRNAEIVAKCLLSLSRKVTTSMNKQIIHSKTSLPLIQQPSQPFLRPRLLSNGNSVALPPNRFLLLSSFRSGNFISFLYFTYVLCRKGVLVV